MASFDEKLLQSLTEQFKAKYSSDPSVVSYAPGRVEVLGNHTDYNEGYVLSAAIDSGTFFLVAPSGSNEIRLTAFNLGDEIVYKVDQIIEEATSGKIDASKEHSWANYVKGVLIELVKIADKSKVVGFNALFGGNLGLGLGLSSSAALEISSGLALSKFFQLQLTNHQLAKIGQKSEHTYVGVKCGLLDQISSLYGKEANLVKTDFRTLEVENAPLGKDLCFLICNTKVTHSLVTSEYNERRESCEGAAKFFSAAGCPNVTHLRDVSFEQYQQFAHNANPMHAKRAAHIIGENKRVIEGQKLLSQGSTKEFGQLLFESHDSSMNNFENSCKELDAIVAVAKSLPEVLGARLSGGGFGGAAIVLVNTGDRDAVKQKIEQLYLEKVGSPCEIFFIKPSAGAQIIKG